jgi:hypothetical protein
MRNSTIRIKMAPCPMCSDKKDKPLTAGLCQNHYWFIRAQKSAEKQTKKEVKKVAGLPDLIDDADAVFSRFIRRSAADEQGFIYCYICGKSVRWQEAEAMHYIKRGASLYLRHDKRNVYAGCTECNQHKDGNYVAFTQRLHEDHPGLVEILQEEAALNYKPTRDELKAIISECSTKLKKL